MELWPEWISELQNHAPELQLQTPLLQIAENAAAYKRMVDLAGRRDDLGLKLIPPDSLEFIWPGAVHGGLQSSQDGVWTP